jgi:hypothetical protein
VILQREAWRPIFLREPVSQRGWPLVTRGVRAYLLRVAEDDGTLLKRCADPFELAKSLGVHLEEADLVRIAIDTLLQDGFLRWDGAPQDPGWLGVDRLVTFGTGDGPPTRPGDDAEEADEHPEERRRRLARERKERWKARQRRSAAPAQSVPAGTEGNVPGVPEGVPSPHSPLSEGQNKQENRTERRGERSGRARAERVPATVPWNAPRASGRGTRSTDPTPIGGLLDAQAEQQRFASEHGLDLDDIAAKCNADPRFSKLGSDDQRKTLTKALMDAAAERERLGGAA